MTSESFRTYEMPHQIVPVLKHIAKSNELSERIIAGVPIKWKKRYPYFDYIRKNLRDENFHLARRALLEACHEAAAKVIIRHSDWIKDAFARDDYVSELLAKLHTKACNYRNEASWQAYVKAIAKNFAVDYLRKLDSWEGRKLSLKPKLNYENEFVTLILAKSLLPAIRKVWNDLPLNSRQILEARHGLPEALYPEPNDYKQISKKLKIPIGTVKSRIHHARENLLRLIPNVMD